MNVSLSVPLEEYINKKVESGLYNSASEIICEGLRSLQEKEQDNARKENLDILLMERLAKLEAGEKTIPAEDVKKSIIKSLQRFSDGVPLVLVCNHV